MTQLQFFKWQSQPDQGSNPESDAHLLNTKPKIRTKPNCFKINIYLTFLCGDQGVELDLFIYLFIVKAVFKSGVLSLEYTMMRA